MDDFEGKDIRNILGNNVFYLFSVSNFFSFDNIFDKGLGLNEEGFDPDDFSVRFVLIVISKVLFVLGLGKEVVIKII